MASSLVKRHSSHRTDPTFDGRLSFLGHFHVFIHHCSPRTVSNIPTARDTPSIRIQENFLQCKQLVMGNFRDCPLHFSIMPPTHLLKKCDPSLSSFDYWPLLPTYHPCFSSSYKHIKPDGQHQHQPPPLAACLTTVPFIK